MWSEPEEDCPLNEEEMASLPLIDPFGRVPPERRAAKTPKPGETHKDGFEPFIYDAIRNSTPSVDQGFVALNLEDAKIVRTQPHKEWSDVHRDACLLWAIDEDRIRLIREQTRNTRRDPQIVCHTNLTGNAKARIGGELFFCEDGSMIINQKSDRYGRASPEQFEIALNYFRRVGYRNLIVVTPDFA
jgi:hypothetical protein